MLSSEAQPPPGSVNVSPTAPLRKVVKATSPALFEATVAVAVAPLDAEPLADLSVVIGVHSVTVTAMPPPDVVVKAKVDCPPTVLTYSQIAVSRLKLLLLRFTQPAGAPSVKPPESQTTSAISVLPAVLFPGRVPLTVPVVDEACVPVWINPTRLPSPPGPRAECAPRSSSRWR